ncbi:hypothetical protein ABW19_dt0207229 [Dactylella cylindrospora]|nr:hypothetical protein ABW19_dt0207229 [Dactylella cylindrospora]
MIEKSAGHQTIGGELVPKLALMGCHDTTVGGVLASLGAFNWRWPPYTSSVAVELFSSDEKQPPSASTGSTLTSWLGIFGLKSKPSAVDPKMLKGWYVRLRYNDTPVQVRYCKVAGRHLEGNPNFCTLEAFKEVVDKLAPDDWKQECQPLKGAQPDQLPPVQLAE